MMNAVGTRTSSSQSSSPRSQFTCIFVSLPISEVVGKRGLANIDDFSPSSVLNLPIYATETEIKERHRALSLIFHPDKQRDERIREHAKERFLEVQAAYESESGPFL